MSNEYLIFARGKWRQADLDTFMRYAAEMRDAPEAFEAEGVRLAMRSLGPTPPKKLTIQSEMSPEESAAIDAMLSHPYWQSVEIPVHPYSYSPIKSSVNNDLIDLREKDEPSTKDTKGHE